METVAAAPAWKCTRTEIYEQLKKCGFVITKDLKDPQLLKGGFCVRSGDSVYFIKMFNKFGDNRRLDMESCAYSVVSDLYGFDCKKIYICKHRDEELRPYALQVPWLGCSDLCDTISSDEYQRIVLNRPMEIGAFAVRVALDLGLVLVRLHEHGIIHGDVKPENVIDGHLRDNEHLRYFLIDFGCSQKWTGSLQDSGGTTAYVDEATMSKEYRYSFECCSSSDTWQLAVLLCLILIGGGIFHKNGLSGFACNHARCRCRGHDQRLVAYNAIYCAFYRDLIIGVYKGNGRVKHMELSLEPSAAELKLYDKIFESGDSLLSVVYRACQEAFTRPGMGVAFFSLLLVALHPYPEHRISAAEFAVQVKKFI
jgi:hypothetical protein